MKTVERIIGHRRGTGGSSGVGFLQKALELEFFRELLTYAPCSGELNLLPRAAIRAARRQLGAHLDLHGNG